MNQKVKRRQTLGRIIGFTIMAVHNIRATTTCIVLDKVEKECIILSKFKYPDLNTAVKEEIGKCQNLVVRLTLSRNLSLTENLISRGSLGIVSK